MLDLHRLHDNYGHKQGQHSGRTTDMVVAALAEIDFMPSGVVLFGRDRKHCMELIGCVRQCAYQMGFANVTRTGPGSVWVNGVLVECTVLTQAKAYRGTNVIPFVDHNAIEGERG